MDFAAALIITYQRSQAIDLSVAYTEDPVSLLIPYPKVDSITIHGIIRPFNYQASEWNIHSGEKVLNSLESTENKYWKSKNKHFFAAVWYR